MCILPGRGVTSFRALFEVKDAMGEILSEKQDSPGITVTRKMACVMASSPQTYSVLQSGLVKYASKLQQPRKGELLHTIVSWQSETALALLAWYSVPAEEAARFKAFFAKEVGIHNEMF